MLYDDLQAQIDLENHGQEGQGQEEHEGQEQDQKNTASDKFQEELKSKCLFRC